VKADYIRISSKTGPGRNDFSTPVTHRIQPDGIRYTKPVVLLTNIVSVSAAERFTLALRNQPDVTHMGTTTRGALSSRMARPMINGWYYTISADKVEDINGICYEGVGIRPAAEFIFSGDWDEWEEPGNRPDKQLNKVLEWLSP
jgi:C-terminal processing protease CtpA/Prc